MSGSRETAEDLAQSTCVRALEKADAFTPGTHLDRWTFHILHRIWLNEMRAAKVRRAGGLQPIEDVELADDNPGVEANIFAREVLSSAMNLPEAMRETVLLVYVEGYSYQEAADLLEIPIGTVMSRLASARKKLSNLASDNVRQAGE